MGQNKRVPELLEANIEHVEHAIERRPEPVSLTIEEVRTGGIRQDAREPIPVAAWIPHRVNYSEPQLVQAEAIAWTRTAVLLRWKAPHSSHARHTWVWANAVTRLRSE